ncbi:MAG TPA: nucleotide sugar dehydrogenase [Gemmatimonadales bacterium]|nr:nucleotide sugar dehydrogenase [Gemmatimonadales bacterium]
MPHVSRDGSAGPWEVREIGVVGPGIVGMPMAALLASAAEGPARTARVTVVQRPSATSGWKVGAINAGRSPIGGVEPALDRIVAGAVAAGRLRAVHDYGALSTAQAILICVQTDRAGDGPEYGPLFEAIDGIAGALRGRPAGTVPLVIFESTLAPSSMTTVVRERFARAGLVEGADVLLGNSPNRVMPGRLIERVASSDKLVAGLSPETPDRIAQLYRPIVHRGALHQTNSLAAEVVKTLENAYRDVRIAYVSELARYCDAHDIDFFRLRDAVNARVAQADAASADPGAVPTGALLVPTVGVGGHCLPKDGILLWWRRLERGADRSRSLILRARAINDASPAATIALAERAFGRLAGRRIAVLGAAYRADSEDTRNAPALVLARLLLGRGCRVTIHDPHVRPTDPNLLRLGLAERFRSEPPGRDERPETAFLCTGHAAFAAAAERLLAIPGLRGIVDGCNLLRRTTVESRGIGYAGIGRGCAEPSAELVELAHGWFRALERGVANEVHDLVEFLDGEYGAGGDGGFGRLDFATVRRLARTCGTGCQIGDAGNPLPAPPYRGWVPELAAAAGRA